MKSKNFSAVMLLASGILLAYISLFLPPPGEIDDSVIYIFAQILIYAGSIFGIEHYISLRLDNRQFEPEPRAESCSHELCRGDSSNRCAASTDNGLKEKTIEIFPKPTI